MTKMLISKTVETSMLGQWEGPPTEVFTFAFLEGDRLNSIQTERVYWDDDCRVSGGIDRISSKGKRLTPLL